MIECDWLDVERRSQLARPASALASSSIDDRHVWSTMIPTEPIGSLPRPPALIEAATTGDDDPRLDALYEDAIRDTIERFEATGSPVTTDGEQRKYHNFWTYSVHGLPNTARDGFRIPSSAGHTRDTAFAKIRARVLGTTLASELLGA